MLDDNAPIEHDASDIPELVDNAPFGTDFGLEPRQNVLRVPKRPRKTSLILDSGAFSGLEARGLVKFAVWVTPATLEGDVHALSVGEEHDHALCLGR